MAGRTVKFYLETVATGDGARKTRGQLEEFERQTGNIATRISKNFQKVGRSLTSAGRSITLFASVPIAGAFAGAINAASDLNEAVTATNVVFGDTAKTVQTWSKTMAEGFGIARKDALDAATGFQNFFLNAGIANKTATDMSTSLVELAGDLASFHNQDPTDMLERIRSGLAGEVEPLRRFGINLSAAAVGAEAVRLGLASSATQVSQNAKVQAAYSLILQQTQRQQGDFARTSDGVANQQRILKARLQDSAAALGNQLLPIVQKAAAFFTDLLDRFNSLNPTVQRFILIGAGLLAVMGPLVGAVGALVTAIGLLLTPVGLVIAAIALLVVGVIYAYQHFEGFRNVVDGVVQWFRDTAIPAFVAAGDWIKQRFQVLADWWAETWPQIAEAVRHAVNVIHDVVVVVMTAVELFWRTFGDAILAYARMVWQAIYAVISSFLGTIRGIINFFLAVINGDWGKAWEAIKSILRQQWELIKGIVSAGLTFLKTILLMAWGAVKRAASAAWEGVRKGISTVWEGIKSTVRSGVNFVIGIINGLISGVNWVLRKLKIPEIPKIPTLGGEKAPVAGGTRGGARPTGAAAGARIGGGFMTNGPQVLVGEGNRAFPEYVIPTDPKYRGRALGLMADLQHHMIPGMQFGGIIGAFKSGFNWAKDKVGGLAGSVLRKALTAGFSPFNTAAKAALNLAPNPFGVRDVVQKLRETIWDWVKGADSALPADIPVGQGVGGGALTGLEDRFEAIVRKILGLGHGRVSLVSGYRSRAQQQRLYARWVAGVPGQARAAPPGRSKHEQGLAVDWGGNRARYTQLSHQFGLVAPVPGEAWHWQPTWAGQTRSYYAAGGTMPSYLNGTRFVERTGPAFVHRGEEITAAGRRRRGANIYIERVNVYANTPEEGRVAAKAFEETLSRRRLVTDARIA